MIWKDLAVVLGNLFKLKIEKFSLILFVNKMPSGRTSLTLFGIRSL
jgi:hypothetical protein